MSPKDDTWRTHAYPAERPSGYDYIFWVMEPAYQKPGYQIREHKIAPRSAFSSRIADGIDEREAMKMMAGLEAREARRTAPVAEDKLANCLGTEEPYRTASHIAAHPSVTTALTQQRLKELKGKKPAFKLK
jgi:hypothetical protein